MDLHTAASARVVAEADWAGLGPDLLLRILALGCSKEVGVLDEVRDSLACEGVCRAWRAALYGEPFPHLSLSGAAGEAEWLEGRRPLVRALDLARVEEHTRSVFFTVIYTGLESGYVQPAEGDEVARPRVPGARVTFRVRDAPDSDAGGEGSDRRIIVNRVGESPTPPPLPRPDVPRALRALPGEALRCLCMHTFFKGMEEAYFYDQMPALLPNLRHLHINWGRAPPPPWVRELHSLRTLKAACSPVDFSRAPALASLALRGIEELQDGGSLAAFSTLSVLRTLELRAMGVDAERKAAAALLRAPITVLRYEYTADVPTPSGTRPLPPELASALDLRELYVAKKRLAEEDMDMLCALATLGTLRIIGLGCWDWDEYEWMCNYSSASPAYIHAARTSLLEEPVLDAAAACLRRAAPALLLLPGDYCDFLRQAYLAQRPFYSSAPAQSMAHRYRRRRVACSCLVYWED